MSAGMLTNGWICGSSGMLTDGWICTPAEAIAKACIDLITQAYLYSSVQSDPLMAASVICEGAATSIRALPFSGISVLADAISGAEQVYNSKLLTNINTAAVDFVTVEGLGLKQATLIAEQISEIELDAAPVAEESISPEGKTIEVTTGDPCP